MYVYSVDAVGKTPKQKNAPFARQKSHEPSSPFVGGRRDAVYFGPKARFKQIIESLNTQKRSVIEQKNKLLADTLEKGGSIEDIEPQLEAFEEKLQLIEESLSTLKSNQAQELLKAQDKNENQPNKEVESEDETQEAQMSNLANVASEMERTRLLSATSSRLKASAKNLEGEIRADKKTLRIKNPHVGDNAPQNQYLSAKRAKLTGLRAKATAAYLQTVQAAKNAQKTAQRGFTLPGPQNAEEEKHVLGDNLYEI